MEGIPGVPAPIPHSKLAGPQNYRFAGSGAGAGLGSQPANRPLVSLSTTGAVAQMSQVERAEYFRSVGQQATARAVAKAIDILA